MEVDVDVDVEEGDEKRGMDGRWACRRDTEAPMLGGEGE